MKLRQAAVIALVLGCAAARAEDDEDTLSLRQAISQSQSAIQAEILKAAAANKAVQEGLAAFRAQVTLQTQAADIAAKMKQPELLCQAMATQDALGAGTAMARTSVFSAQRQTLARIGGNTNTMAALDSSYRLSNEKFCAEEESAAGICKASTTPEYANLAGADQNALFLFQSRTGGDSYEGTRNGPQSQAVDAYIARVVAGGTPPTQLPARGKSVYQSNPQARAHVETLRRYNAFMSMASYSLNRIKESRQPAAK